MNIEQKAKAYDKALESAKGIIEQNPLMEYLKKGIEYIFPGLKESEDERIRKTLIEYFNAYPKDYYGELKKSHILAWLEKQGEQKLADKVIKPKFHEGEWVVFNNRHDSVYQVEKIENYEYTLRHFLGGSMPLSFSHEDMIRAWTVKDARDGDVLADSCQGFNNPFICILKRFENVDFGLAKLSDFSSYCYLTMNDNQKFKKGHYHHMHNIQPATKEQRDTLFAKMKEAGYEWDADKKELRQIACDKFIRKEMYFDFDSELVKYIDDNNAFIKDDYVVEKNNGDSFDHIYDLEGVAKHFFELGLAQQNDKQNE